MSESKIVMKSSNTFEEVFERFLMVKKAAGIANKTLESFGHHFHALEKYLDVNIDMAAIHKEHFDTALSTLRGKGLKPNSIKSYIRTPKSFLGWCNAEGITLVNIPLYKKIKNADFAVGRVV